MKYIKNPIPIEAIRLPKSVTCLSDWYQWLYASAPMPEWFLHAYYNDGLEFTDDGLMVKTLEGKVLCRWGNIIIHGVAGEIYPCQYEIFKQTYTPEEETNNGISNTEEEASHE